MSRVIIPFRAVSPLGHVSRSRPVVLYHYIDTSVHWKPGRSRIDPSTSQASVPVILRYIQESAGNEHPARAALFLPPNRGIKVQ